MVGSVLSEGCSLMTDQSVRCWGANYNGELGRGDIGDARGAPAVVPGLLAVQVVAGRSHRCALSADGLVRCWGSNGNGECGLPGAVSAQPTPTVVPGLTEVEEIAATLSHTCARRRDGTVWCWGFNYYGQLGIPYDGTGEGGALTRVDLPAAASRIGCGDSMSCAALAGGQLWCWGVWKPDAQEMTTPGSPPRYLADGGDIGQIVMAPRRLCVVRASTPDFVSGLGCADNRDSSLVPPQSVDGIKRIEVMNAVWTQLAISEITSCAVATDGRLFCWGDNTFGQIGTGQSGDIGPGPTPVSWRQE
jgi:alpha-tubulin suppressor-like RCC1 family protein